ncbi:hypothetical protein Q9189_006148, partial [Teloschistes chrysophthalmus]
MANPRERWTKEEFEAAYLLSKFTTSLQERARRLNGAFGGHRTPEALSAALVRAKRPGNEHHQIWLRWERLAENDRRNQGIIALQRLLGDPTLTWQGLSSTTMPGQAAAAHTFVHTIFYDPQVALRSAPTTAPTTAPSHAAPFAGDAAPRQSPPRRNHHRGRHQTIPEPTNSLQANRDNWGSGAALPNRERPQPVPSHSTLSRRHPAPRDWPRHRHEPAPAPRRSLPAARDNRGRGVAGQDVGGFRTAPSGSNPYVDSQRTLDRPYHYQPAPAPRPSLQAARQNRGSGAAGQDVGGFWTAPSGFNPCLDSQLPRDFFEPAFAPAVSFGEAAQDYQGSGGVEQDARTFVPAAAATGYEVDAGEGIVARLREADRALRARMRADGLDPDAFDMGGDMGGFWTAPSGFNPYVDSQLPPAFFQPAPAPAPPASFEAAAQDYQGSGGVEQDARTFVPAAAATGYEVDAREGIMAQLRDGERAVRESHRALRASMRADGLDPDDFE